MVLRPQPPQLALPADLGRGQLAEAWGHAATLRGCAMSHRLDATIAVAPTPTLATLAARVATSDVPLVVGPAGVRALLDRCPVSWLEPFAPLAALLHGLGLRSLGAVAALQGWHLLQGEEVVERDGLAGELPGPAAGHGGDHGAEPKPAGAQGDGGE